MLHETSIYLILKRFLYIGLSINRIDWNNKWEIQLTFGNKVKNDQLIHNIN